MKSHFKIALLVVLVGIAYGAYDGYDFLTGEAEKLEQQIITQTKQVDDLRAESEKLKSFADNIQAIKREFRELNLQLESVLEHLPRAFNISILLRNVSMLADNSGVQLSAFRPRGDEEKANGSFYASTTVEFSVLGTFTQTLLFFDQLSRLKRIVNIESLKMNGSSETGTLVASGVKSTSTVVVRTYRLAE